MNTDLPIASEIDRSVERLRGRVMARTAGRSRARRLGIGAAAVGALTLAGVGGAGIATAFHPSTIDMQGVIKTKFVDAFVDCSEKAGVETVILTGSAAQQVLDGWPDADPATHSVIESRMDARYQGDLGRALSACQAEVVAGTGETIR